MRTTRQEKRPPSPRRRAPRTKFAGVKNDDVVSATFELTRAERTRLTWIAASLGMSQTDLLRAWIRDGRAPGRGEEVETTSSELRQ